jgi:hypothetical protein
MASRLESVTRLVTTLIVANIDINVHSTDSINRTIEKYYLQSLTYREFSLNNLLPYLTFHNT